MKRLCFSVLVLAMVFVSGCSLAPVAINGIVTFDSEVSEVSIRTSAGICDVVPRESNSFAFSGYARKYGDELIVEYFALCDGNCYTAKYGLVPAKESFINLNISMTGDIIIVIQ
jgi:hypothetical protein